MWHLRFNLHLSYQHLLVEHTKLVEVDRELGERLMMFQSVSTADIMTHKLTSPTLSVQSETFLPTIDTGMVLVYLLAHPNDSESPAYITKFRACLTRVLEMVRSHMK